MARFCYKGVGPIKIVNGRSNAESYLDYLTNYVNPFSEINYYGLDFYLLRDDAPIHTAQIVGDLLTSRLPSRVHAHPPYSPDLNPIEDI